MTKKMLLVAFCCALVVKSASSQPLYVYEEPRRPLDSVLEFVWDHYGAFATGTTIAAATYYYVYMREAAPARRLDVQARGVIAAANLLRVQNLPRNVPVTPAPTSNQLQTLKGSVPAPIPRRPKAETVTEILQRMVWQKVDQEQIVLHIQRMTLGELREIGQRPLFWELLGGEGGQLIFENFSPEQFGVVLQYIAETTLWGRIDDEVTRKRLDAILRAIKATEVQDSADVTSFFTKLRLISKMRRAIVAQGYVFQAIESGMDDFAFHIVIALAPLQMMFKHEATVIAEIKEITKNLKLLR